MEKQIVTVFKIIGMLVLATVLMGAFFGTTGRTLMWGAIEPTMKKHWAEVTMNDGLIVGNVNTELFNKAQEIQIIGR